MVVLNAFGAHPLHHKALSRDSMSTQAKESPMSKMMNTTAAALIASIAVIAVLGKYMTEISNALDMGIPMSTIAPFAYAFMAIAMIALISAMVVEIILVTRITAEAKWHLKCWEAEMADAFGHNFRVALDKEFGKEFSQI